MKARSPIYQSVCIVIVFCIWTTSARGDNLSYGVKLGLVSGSGTYIPGATNTTEKTFNYAGLAIGLALYKELHSDLSLLAQGQILVDSLNVLGTQILRRGLQLGLYYRLLGGSPSFTQHYYGAKVTDINSWGLAILGRTAYEGYDSVIVAQDKSKTHLKGAVIPFSIGIDCRKSWSEQRSFGLEILHTVGSVAASSEFVKPRDVEVAFYMRSLL